MDPASPALQPHYTPGVASAENGHVVLDGPNGVAVTMTAMAAAQTGQSLLEAAAEAERQQLANPSEPSAS